MAFHNEYVIGGVRRIELGTRWIDRGRRFRGYTLLTLVAVNEDGTRTEGVEPIEMPEGKAHRHHTGRALMGFYAGSSTLRYLPFVAGPHGGFFPAKETL